MIIDFHAHAFPGKIANFAIDKLSPLCGNVSPTHNGTVQSLISNMKKDGCDKAVVLNIATNATQQTNVNDFAISLLRYDEIIPFGSVHPDNKDALKELERLKEFGVKGVKFHPDYQGYFVDDKSMHPIYKKISELGLVTVFHAGVDIGKPSPIHCTPDRLLSVLPLFKGAPVVAAHMGGYMLWRDVIKNLMNEDIYFDTSYSFSKMPPLWANEMIDKHGEDRFLFGTDAPWSSVSNELKFINSLNLSSNTKDKILYKNAKKLLSI